MVKKITLIGFLLIAVAINSNAQNSNRIDQDDSYRIEQLEEEVQELKLRLSKLESLLSNPSKAQELSTSSEGWKSVVNWRKLTTGMSTSDVQKILGAPHRVNGGNITFWYYQNDGEVVFMGGKVYQWKEPRQ
ncbi:MAG TPA: hypothetical protein PKY89_00505 [Deltaproteobacteria bacterium]|nr:hypothetical protein [Deltaproteobacteria bacterium]